VYLLQHHEEVQLQQLNVVAFVRKIMDNFESVAEEHNIDFLFQTEKEALNLWVDADKFEKIVFNLLSNAFKYTPNGKMITVFIREDEGTVSVGVQDQGIGIAENKPPFSNTENGKEFALSGSVYSHGFASRIVASSIAR
jgi:signal transduction histidine kinase